MVVEEGEDDSIRLLVAGGVVEGTQNVKRWGMRVERTAYSRTGGEKGRW